MELSNILEERKSQYGDFKAQAYLSQRLKSILIGGYSYHKLSPHQRESLEMILHKVSRIINGDPSYADSWRDIAGYAQLIVNELDKAEEFKLTNTSNCGYIQTATVTPPFLVNDIKTNENFKT